MCVVYILFHFAFEKEPARNTAETVITRFHISVPIPRKRLSQIWTEYLSHTNGSL